MDRIVQEISRKLPQMPKRLRVAAYGRVSSDKDSMLHSLAAQVEYYSRLIQEHRDWVYCGVYSDEGITGTKEERPGFQRLLADCRAGKIDMVITKAVSRFARNTTTTLSSIRELKALGVDVFFEENNIHTMGEKGELMITLLASIAQEESRSASDNQKWRIRHGFEQGELMTLKFIFGYTVRKGLVEINEKEACIVREIFQRVISGESLNSVARDMDKCEIRKPLGGHWSPRAIHDLLTNEKYTGDALLQKTFINNHLEKKVVKNRGQVRQYFVEDSHPAIISRETFMAAQQVLKALNEKTSGRAPAEHTPFSYRVICGNCGKLYKRITVTGRKFYQCGTYHSKGKAFCDAKRIPEGVLYEEATAAMGLSEFDEPAFIEQVERVTVLENNRLFFSFRDGHTVERVWKDRSRADSWTPKMKEKARQSAIEQRRRNRECQQGR